MNRTTLWTLGLTAVVTLVAEAGAAPQALRGGSRHSRRIITRGEFAACRLPDRVVICAARQNATDPTRHSQMSVGPRCLVAGAGLEPATSGL